MRQNLASGRPRDYILSIVLFGDLHAGLTLLAALAFLECRVMGSDDVDDEYRGHRRVSDQIPHPQIVLQQDQCLTGHEGQMMTSMLLAAHVNALVGMIQSRAVGQRMLDLTVANLAMAKRPHTVNVARPVIRFWVHGRTAYVSGPTMICLGRASDMCRWGGDDC